MSKAAKIANEVLDFVASTKVECPLAHGKILAQFDPLEKQIRSLLVWQHVLTPIALTHPNSTEASRFLASAYSQAISDVVQAVLLWSQNHNRPALMMIRSASDQIINALSRKNEIDIESIRRVSERVAEIKKMYRTDDPTIEICTDIHQIYKSSSLVVHSSDPLFQDVGSSFKDIVKYREKNSSISLSTISNFIKRFNEILYLEHFSLIESLTYINRDLILCSLRKKVKKFVNR